MNIKICQKSFKNKYNDFYLSVVHWAITCGSHFNVFARNGTDWKIEKDWKKNSRLGRFLVVHPNQYWHKIL